MSIFKKSFKKKFCSSLKKENKEIRIKEIKSSFCFKNKKKEMLGLKAFLPKKQVRMIFIIFHNCNDREKCKINFIFLIGPIEGKNIRYKEIRNLHFSMEILDEKELENQLKSFLLNETINPDYFINNKFKK